MEGLEKSCEIRAFREVGGGGRKGQRLIEGEISLWTDQAIKKRDLRDLIEDHKNPSRISIECTHQKLRQ